MLKFFSKMPSMPTTQQQLAHHLGLSEGAISMALRNHPRISLTTRKRVQALARRKGYITNPAFSRRSATRHGQRAKSMMPLALITQPNPVSGPDGGTFTRQLSQLARQFGYSLGVHSHQPHEHAARLGEVLYNRGIEAVLVGPVFYRRLIDEFPWRRFSLAGYEGGHHRPPCHLVMPDIAEAIAQARAHCVSQGYRRIAFAQIAEPRPPVDHLDRYATSAFFRGTRAGVRFSSRDFTLEQKSRFQSWIRATRPDAVIGQAEFFYWWLTEMGLHVPGDIGYLNLRMDESRYARHLSGFMIDHSLTCKIAIQLVDWEVRQFLRGPPDAPARMLVPMTWVPGATLPPRRT
jgi:LacI family transcriptional regulator